MSCTGLAAGGLAIEASKSASNQRGVRTRGADSIERSKDEIPRNRIQAIIHRSRVMGLTRKWKQPQVRTDLPAHAVQLRGRRRRRRTRRRRVPSRCLTFSGGGTPETWPLAKRTGGSDGARRLAWRGAGAGEVERGRRCGDLVKW